MTELNTSASAVFFDLDGTLLDTAPDFVTVLNRQLARHGKAAIPETAIRATVSDGARALIQLGFGVDHAPRARLAALVEEQVRQVGLEG